MTTPAGSRRETTTRQLRQLVRAINEGDDTLVESAIRSLAARHRFLAPLGLVVGGFAMLFEGLKLLFSNWRLTLVQLLPAMWIWVAMLDLKAHLLRGRSFHVLRGPILIPLVLLIAAITAASFFLNAVFAFAIATPGPPKIRPGFARAREHEGVVFGWGFAVGVALGVATLVFPRWGEWWFGLALSIVIGIMMVLYVSIPSRLIGMKAAILKRDALKASVVGGALGAAVCSPPFAIARVGLLMLGVRALFIPGLFVVTLGLVLQAGATSSVKAIQMSAKLVAGNRPAATSATATASAAEDAPGSA